MTSRTRLQAPFRPSKTENPYLTPHMSRETPFAARGRFQDVNARTEAQERTRVAAPSSSTVTVSEKVEIPPEPQKAVKRTTTVVEE